MFPPGVVASEAGRLAVDQPHRPDDLGLVPSDQRPISRTVPATNDTAVEVGAGLTGRRFGRRSASVDRQGRDHADQCREGDMKPQMSRASGCRPRAGRPQPGA